MRPAWWHPEPLTGTGFKAYVEELGAAINWVPLTGASPSRLAGTPIGVFHWSCTMLVSNSLTSCGIVYRVAVCSTSCLPHADQLSRVCCCAKFPGGTWMRRPILDATSRRK